MNVSATALARALNELPPPARAGQTYRVPVAQHLSPSGHEGQTVPLAHITLVARELWHFEVRYLEWFITIQEN